MQVMHNLLILVRNRRFAISFLRFVNFDLSNYNFNLIRIVLISYNSINKSSYFNRSIIIKANLRVRLK